MNWMTIVLLTVTGMVLIAVDFYLPGFVLGSIGVVLMLVATAICYSITNGVDRTIMLFCAEVALGISAGYASINMWIQARMTGAPVSFLRLLSMRLRRVPIGLVVQSRITAVKAGLPLTTDQLEAHYLAGGDVNQVVRALIAAEKANLNLGFNQAAAIDLATHQSGKSVFEAVMTSVNPKVIDCPNPPSGKQTIAAVAKDRIQLQLKARVTGRTHLDRCAGGATEETIIARVGEGIATPIRTPTSYKDAPDIPDPLSKRVLQEGLHACTASGLLSID